MPASVDDPRFQIDASVFYRDSNSAQEQANPINPDKSTNAPKTGDVMEYTPLDKTLDPMPMRIAPLERDTNKLYSDTPRGVEGYWLRQDVDRGVPKKSFLDHLNDIKESFQKHLDFQNNQQNNQFYLDSDKATQLKSKI